MTSTLQNRLVGTIIVVALVVILLPEVLDGEKRINKQTFVNVPPVADLVEIEGPEPFDTEAVAEKVSQPVEIVDETAIDDESDTDDAASSKAKSDENNSSNKKAEVANNTSNSSETDLSDIEVKDSGWVVQLGSFRHQKNVKELLKKLNDAGYRAYSRPVMTNVGELNKVFVGPELEKQKLEKALPHLQELTKLKGKITAFEVSAK